VSVCCRNRNTNSCVYLYWLPLNWVKQDKFKLWHEYLSEKHYYWDNLDHFSKVNSDHFFGIECDSKTTWITFCANLVEIIRSA
jgi:hypothetical protein